MHFVIYFYGLSTSEGKFLRLKLRIQCALLIQINAYSDGDILTYCSLWRFFFHPFDLYIQSIQNTRRFKSMEI